MLLISTYVAQSPIEGLGVFAGEAVRRGELFWSFNPKFDICIRPEELEGLPPHMLDYIRRYTYPHLEAPGVVSEWFRWARVGADGADDVAERAGFAVAGTREVGGRTFVTLRRR